jgi:hypothetical protein
MKNQSSSGHKLGQIIGDWYEEFFALPILEKASEQLGLFLDCRFKKRACRSGKIIWQDLDGNKVDYDFVMELGGSDSKKGVPVAFFETFWRRGARHSKDKARDDSGKLLPMKATYPTARVLGVISAGDFTSPARELVISRGIDLFYVEKQKIVDAWAKCDLDIDYPDDSSESIKANVSMKIINELKKNPLLYQTIAAELLELCNQKAIDSYIHRLVGKIGAIPQKYSIQIQSKTKPIEFESHIEVDSFLQNKEPTISNYEKKQYYGYTVDFSDGDEFVRDGLSWQELIQLHNNLKQLVDLFF